MYDKGKIMKKTLKLIAAIAFAAIIAFALAGCEGKKESVPVIDNSPAGLAKQAFDLSLESMKVYETGDESNMDELTKKLDELKTKVEMLSDEDQYTFNMEFMKLLGEYTY